MCVRVCVRACALVFVFVRACARVLVVHLWTGSKKTSKAPSLSMHKVPTAVSGHLINSNTSFASMQRERSEYNGELPALSLDGDKAGCRLKDWSQRQCELDFKTCQLRSLSRRVAGASHEVGFIQKDTIVKAGIWLTIEDPANRNNDAVLWTFEVTFVDDHRYACQKSPIRETCQTQKSPIKSPIILKRDPLT